MMVLYECDRKRCPNCTYPSCKHTGSIEHAKNFIPSGLHDEEVYEEKIVKDIKEVYVVVIDEINESTNFYMRMPIGVYSNKIKAKHVVRNLPKEANPHIYRYNLEN